MIFGSAEVLHSEECVSAELSSIRETEEFFFQFSRAGSRGWRHFCRSSYVLSYKKNVHVHVLATAVLICIGWLRRPTLSSRYELFLSFSIYNSLSSVSSYSFSPNSSSVPDFFLLQFSPFTYCHYWSRRSSTLPRTAFLVRPANLDSSHRDSREWWLPPPCW